MGRALGQFGMTRLGNRLAELESFKHLVLSQPKINLNSILNFFVIPKIGEVFNEFIKLFGFA